MRQVTNFNNWLEGSNKPQSSFDLYSLWQASLGRSHGLYQSEYIPGTDRLVITGRGDEYLVLRTSKAMNDFRFALGVLVPAPVSPEQWVTHQNEAEQVSDPVKTASLRPFRPFKPKRTRRRRR